MLHVVVDKEGVHNNVKFVVSFDVSAYVEGDVPPHPLNIKLLLLLTLDKFQLKE